jgi:Zinc-binding dehydrogenase
MDAAAGRLDVKPTRTFRFEEIREAHRVMEANEAKGKMVVVHDQCAFARSVWRALHKPLQPIAGACIRRALVVRPNNWRVAERGFTAALSGSSLLSGGRAWGGIDLSAYPLDGPLPPLPELST